MKVGDVNIVAGEFVAGALQIEAFAVHYLSLMHGPWSWRDLPPHTVEIIAALLTALIRLRRVRDAAAIKEPLLALLRCCGVDVNAADLTTLSELVTILSNLYHLDRGALQAAMIEKVGSMASHEAKALMLKEAVADRIFALFDVDHDDCITFAEWRASFDRVHLPVPVPIRKHIFDAVDLDGNGTLTRPELLEAIHKLQRTLAGIVKEKVGLSTANIAMMTAVVGLCVAAIMTVIFMVTVGVRDNTDMWQHVVTLAAAIPTIGKARELLPQVRTTVESIEGYVKAHLTEAPKHSGSPSDNHE